MSKGSWLYKKWNKNVMGCGMREVYVSLSIVICHDAFGILWGVVLGIG